MKNEKLSPLEPKLFLNPPAERVHPRGAHTDFVCNLRFFCVFSATHFLRVYVAYPLAGDGGTLLAGGG